MDKAKAIELLNKALGCMKADPKDCVRKKCSLCKHHATKEDGIEAISMAIEALEKAPKWIPVTERMPKKEFDEGVKNGTVYDLYPCLVTRTAKHSVINPNRIYVAKHYFDGEEFLNINSDVVTEQVVAWMPLPEPWEGEVDE